VTIIYRVAGRGDLSQTDKNHQVFGQSEQQLHVRKVCELTSLLYPEAFLPIVGGL
jgi:hypothetical protein